MKNIELYSILKDTRDDVTGFWVTTRDIYSGMTHTMFLHEYTSKRALIAYLRSRGIICPHRAYRNK